MESLEKEKQILKKTNLTISRNLKKLDRELVSLEREFNWLMRQHYQEYHDYFLDEVKVKGRDKVKDNSNKSALDLLENPSVERKITSIKKKHKKKRIIVWNAWVVDTSSESDSDCDSNINRREDMLFIGSSSDSE